MSTKSATDIWTQAKELDRERAQLIEDKRRLIEVVRLYLHRESQPTVDIVATDLLAELENRSSKEQA